MEPRQRQRSDGVKIPQWFWKFVLCETRGCQQNEQFFLAILKPMAPQDWCRIWVPIIHPDVEAPLDGERSPPGYMKACVVTLCKLTGYSECTVEGWFYGKSYHHTVGILLRCIHILFKFQRVTKISDVV